jgi:hypothetical protein
VNVKQFVWRSVLPVFIGIAAYTYVVVKLSSFSGWDEFFLHVHSGWGGMAAMVLFQLFLLGFNLSIETLKWNRLTASFFYQPFNEGLKQVLTGMSAGSFTPVRIGEPAGRLMMVPKGYRLPSLARFFMGSILQNVVIVIGSLLAMPWFVAHNSGVGVIENLESLSPFIFVLIVVAVFVLVGIGYRYRKLLAVAFRNRIMADAFTRIRLPLITATALLSLLRYIVYSVQLLLWLVFFNVGEVLTLLPVLPLYFLFITIIPSVFLTDLGVRGSVAGFLFSIVSPNVAGIIGAVFAFWVINGALPVLIGASLQFVALRSSESNSQLDDVNRGV